MIVKEVVENCKEIELANTFPQYFKENSVKKQLIDNEFTQIYTYFTNNIICAFIQFDIMYERAELVQIEVLREFRRKNIGTELLELMLEICKSKNVKSITLEVRKNNLAAINLYKKFGFTPISVRKKYYENKIDAILMEKEMI